jgi:hypothetical protein
LILIAFRRRPQFGLLLQSGLTPCLQLGTGLGVVGDADFFLDLRNHRKSEHSARVFALRRLRVGWDFEQPQAREDAEDASHDNQTSTSHELPL